MMRAIRAVSVERGRDPRQFALLAFGGNGPLFAAALAAELGIKRMIVGSDSANEWNLIMATAILAMLPPALVVMLMQKWFVKGLVETEK